MILVVIIAGFLILEARLLCIQIIQGNMFSERAERLYCTGETLPMPRGRIVDCRNTVLAASIPSIDVYADCDQLENPHTEKCSEKDLTIGLLAPFFGMKESDLRVKVDRNPDAYVRVAAGITDQTLIRELNLLKEKRLLRGIHFEKQFKRRYSHHDLMGHTIGFVNSEAKGVCGVEALADGFLKGVDGYRRYTRDGIRNEVSIDDTPVEWGMPGGTVQLTLDAAIQLFAEIELAEIERLHDPKWAAAVVLEPGTGRILAAASIPSIDPSNPAEGREGHWTNHVFNATYQPGSSFKPLFMALALDSGRVGLSEQFDCGHGSRRFGSRRVTDSHGYGMLTTSGIIVKSSNIGMAQIALRMIPESCRKGDPAFAPLRSRLERLGLGRKPGVLRPSEEMAGLITPLENWSRIYTTISVSYGYEMAVTPIQMASAFMTIANKGIYIPPRLIESYCPPDGQRVEMAGAPSCPVYSRETSESVTRMLVKVVEEGTGTKAQIPGCPVAGKTGTARKAQDRTRHTASFIAFAPADNPTLLALVVVDEPKGAIYGGSVAAPRVKKILQKGLAPLGVQSKSLVMAEDRRAGDDIR